MSGYSILLEELVILLVQADGVLTPELLRLVHRAPFQAAGLELRAVLIEWAGDKRERTSQRLRGVVWRSPLWVWNATSSQPINCQEFWFQRCSQWSSGYSKGALTQIHLVLMWALSVVQHVVLISKNDWCSNAFVIKCYAWNEVHWVPEILHALSQPLQQELDVLSDILIIVLLLLKVLQLLQHFALNHGQSVFLAGLPLCRLLQKVL